MSCNWSVLYYYVVMCLAIGVQDFFSLQDVWGEQTRLHVLNLLVLNTVAIESILFMLVHYVCLQLSNFVCISICFWLDSAYTVATNLSIAIWEHLLLLHHKPI